MNLIINFYKQITPKKLLWPENGKVLGEDEERVYTSHQVVFQKIKVWGIRLWNKIGKMCKSMHTILIEETTKKLKFY